MNRDAIVPDLDPDVTMIGQITFGHRKIDYPKISAVDLRDASEASGEDVDRKIRGLVSSFPRLWTQVESSVAVMEGAIGTRQGIFKDGLMTIGSSHSLNVELRHARISRGGADIRMPEPAVTYAGRSGYVVYHAGFNFYHFFSDMLLAVEAFYNHRHELDLDRVIIGIPEDVATGFQLEMLETLYPDFVGKFIFEGRAVYCESLAFFYLLPGMVSRNADGTMDFSIPHGTGGNVIRTNQESAMRRASSVAATYRKEGTPWIILGSRQKAKIRKIVNEDALYERLEPLGCARIHFEDLTLRQKMEVLSGADVVFFPHGSGMVNTVFCPPGAKVVELTSLLHLNRSNWLTKYAVGLDFDWYVAICNKDGEGSTVEDRFGGDIRLSDAALDWCVRLCQPA